MNYHNNKREMVSAEIQPITIELVPEDDPGLESFLQFEKEQQKTPYLRADTRKNIECAGRAFDAYYSLLTQVNENENETEPESESGSKSPEAELKADSDKAERLFSGQWAHKKKKMSMGEAAKQSLFKDNYYEILGLENVGLNATDADIKSAYRKLAILYHPDKVNEQSKAKDPAQEEKKAPVDREKQLNKEIWLKLQQAYEILSDPDSRKQYDSSLPFDDSIPSDSEDINDENFYDTYYFPVERSRFGPAFMRNAQFSKVRPIPNLGGPDTSMDQVEKFYNFW